MRRLVSTLLGFGLLATALATGVIHTQAQARVEEARADDLIQRATVVLYGDNQTCRMTDGRVWCVQNPRRRQ